MRFGYSKVRQHLCTTEALQNSSTLQNHMKALQIQQESHYPKCNMFHEKYLITVQQYP